MLDAMSLPLSKNEEDSVSGTSLIFHDKYFTDYSKIVYLVYYFISLEQYDKYLVIYFYSHRWYYLIHHTGCWSRGIIFTMNI